MPDNIPETGDVVIHGSDANATLPYAICTVPGRNQLAFATLEEAESMASRYAARSEVNLWLSEAPSGVVLLARFRGPRMDSPATADHRGRGWRALPNRQSTTIV